VPGATAPAPVVPPRRSVVAVCRRSLTWVHPGPVRLPEVAAIRVITARGGYRVLTVVRFVATKTLNPPSNATMEQVTDPVRPTVHRLAPLIPKIPVSCAVEMAVAAAGQVGMVCLA